MSPVINATATKPTPSSKIGLWWAVKDNCVKITKVVEGGLFSTSELKEGQEIITINGSHVDGLDNDEVRVIFASIKTDIHITARPKPFIAFFKINRRAQSNTVHYDYDMNCNRHEIPEILEAAGVPLHKWRKIYHLIKSEMAEATSKSVELDRIFREEMGVYTGKQMSKGYLGFGQESNHEKKVINMTHQCAALANNATLTSTDVSIRANALLAPHGITVSVFLKSLLLPKYSTKQKGEAHEANKPFGLRFMSL